MLIHRRANPAFTTNCQKIDSQNNNRHTGISMILTTALVLRSPIIISKKIKAKNKAIKQATEAGKDTELNPIRELTPKHARRIKRIPAGM